MKRPATIPLMMRCSATVVDLSAVASSPVSPLPDPVDGFEIVLAPPSSRLRVLGPRPGKLWACVLLRVLGGPAPRGYTCPSRQGDPHAPFYTDRWRRSDYFSFHSPRWCKRPPACSSACWGPHFTVASWGERGTRASGTSAPEPPHVRQATGAGDKPLKTPRSMW